MKIVEIEAACSEHLKTWVNSLIRMEEDEFFLTISQTHQWEFERLIDLQAISPLLNRVDSLLDASTLSKNYPDLSVLLDFSILLLSGVLNKTLYNSYKELNTILDIDNWEIIFKVLRLLKVLIGGKGYKPFKDEKIVSFMHKLYVIGLGSHLNNPRPISLQDLVSDVHIEIIPFQFKHENSQDPVPISLQYVLVNRTRTNSSLASKLDRSLIVACQFQALSLFFIHSPKSSLLLEFYKTLPEIWLLPSLADFIRTPSTIEIQSSVLDLISSIMFSLETSGPNAYYSQFSSLSQEFFTTWNGIILNLLRDLTIPQSPFLPSFSHPEIALSLLDLVSIISQCSHRHEILNLSTITCSLLCIIKNSAEDTINYSHVVLKKSVKILIDIIPNVMSMFKEAEGMQTIIKMANKEIISISENVDLYDAQTGLKVNPVLRLSFMRKLLKIVKVALSKWDQVPSTSNDDIQVLIDIGLLDVLCIVFSKHKYKIYKEALAIITQIVSEIPGLISDLLTNGLIKSLLESLEIYVPNNSKLIDNLSRFLYIISNNIDGAKILENYNTITKLILALGNTDPVHFTTNIASSISESLQEISSSVQGVSEKIIEGFLQLVDFLKQSDISIPIVFFNKVLNTGRLFGSVFAINPEIVKGFMSRGGLDALLDIFKIKAQLKSDINEFHPLTTCFKCLPGNSVAQVLSKVLDTLNLHIQKTQEITGPWNTIRDFSLISKDRTKELFNMLFEGDCYLEIIRILLQNWSGIVGTYKEFIDVLVNVSLLQRVLISEQSRLMCRSNKIQDKTIEKFDFPSDSRVIEDGAKKSFQENVYFACQMTIRKVFRSAMRIPNSRGRNSSNEEAGIAVSKALGRILADNVKALKFDPFEYENIYSVAMKLSDIINVLLYEQGTTLALVLQFVLEGGAEAFSDFLSQLMHISFEVASLVKFSYHLANSLQILWTLSGKFLETLVLGKYINPNFGLSVVRTLGFNNTKDALKKIQMIVLDCLKKINYLECGVLSTNFAKSVLEIIKFVCNLNKDILDPKKVKTLMDMGFNAQTARLALTETRSASVEVAMEWIFSHQELVNIPREAEPSSGVTIDSLHLIVLNSIVAIPSLSSIIGDILVKISLSKESINEEIALSLLTITGKLVQELLKDSNLNEVMMDMVPLNLPNIPATFEQLGACLHIIQILCTKNPSILDIIRENYFSGHITNFLNSSNIDQFKGNWISYAFSLLDMLIKSGEPGSESMVATIVKILKSHCNHPSAGILKEQEMASLLNLLVTLTFTPELSKFFLGEGGLQALLQCKKPHQSQNPKSSPLPLSELFRQLCEDPYIIQCTYEISFLQSLNSKIPLNHFLKLFKAQVYRSKNIFTCAFKNSCKVTKTANDNFVEKKLNRGQVTGEKWDTIQILVKAVGDMFNLEQKSHEAYYINTEKLLNVLADLFITYPILIYEIMNLDLDIYDRASNLIIKKPFIKSLIHNVLPLKYIVKITEGKINLIDPATGALVPSSIYQNWIKAAIKLIRSMSFKQSYKQTDPNVSEAINELMLNYNKPVDKCRKMLFTEICETISEHLKTQWFSSPASLTSIRILTTLLLNVLRDPPKAPFQASECIELARLLTNENTSMLLLLTEATKGIDPLQRRAGSIFNLILALLELLLKCNLNFTLKTEKPQEIAENTIQIFAENNFSEDSNSEGPEGQDDPEELGRSEGPEGQERQERQERQEDLEVLEDFEGLEGLEDLEEQEGPDLPSEDSSSDIQSL